MRIRSARTGVTDRPDHSVPDQLFYFELVRALYRTTKSIFSATVAALTIIAISWALSGDAVYLAFFAAFMIVGAWRTGNILLYDRTRLDKTDYLQIKRWELFALIGAWAFAGLV